MARKKAAKQPEKVVPPPVRSTLHDVLRGRTAARHQRESEKRVAQKLRRELEQDG